MSISINRYVNITSGVGAGTVVGTRSLILRLFDDNQVIPTGTAITFTNANDVATYFGSSSVEYSRAAFYFGWISKEITSPRALSFARWNSAASAPQIFGTMGSQALASYTSITSGSFTLTLGGTTNTISGLNFSSAGSLAGVASVIQTAIRTKTGAMWTNATVAWDAVFSRFTLTGGTTGPGNVIVVAGTGGNDVAAQLGWLSAATILSNGAALQSITDVLNQSSAYDNNFGSFAFTASLTQSQIVEGATWNDAQNNMFAFTVPVNTTNAAAISAAVFQFSGIELTLDLQTPGEYHEQMPAMIVAATDYTAPNATQNFMYQIFSATPTVLTNADANTYDALRVNYYGQTQTAGQTLQFYQRGYMMGIATDALDQNTYYNEMWLKDAASAAIMTILLALPEVPVNNRGLAMLKTILQSVINQALNNGVISVGRALSTAQKLYISQISNDPNAWKQVQNIGYWFDIVFQQEVINNATEYVAVYTLIYSDDEVVRKVEGRDILMN